MQLFSPQKRQDSISTLVLGVQYRLLLWVEEGTDAAVGLSGRGARGEPAGTSVVSWSYEFSCTWNTWRLLFYVLVAALPVEHWR